MRPLQRTVDLTARTSHFYDKQGQTDRKKYKSRSRYPKTRRRHMEAHSFSIKRNPLFTAKPVRLYPNASSASHACTAETMSPMTKSATRFLMKNLFQTYLISKTLKTNPCAREFEEFLEYHKCSCDFHKQFPDKPLEKLYFRKTNSGRKVEIW